MSTTAEYAHLSEPDAAWLAVAEAHAPLDALASKMYSLPIAEFRKVPYKPGPLPDNIPQPGVNINIRTDTVVVRDGASIGVRIYEPLKRHSGHPLFFNVHGGGWTVGTPETEEAQNRLVAAGTDAVVVSVDYRLAPEYPFPYAVHDSMDALLWVCTPACKIDIVRDHTDTVVHRPCFRPRHRPAQNYSRRRKCRRQYCMSPSLLFCPLFLDD